MYFILEASGNSLSRLWRQLKLRENEHENPDNISRVSFPEFCESCSQNRNCHQQDWISIFLILIYRISYELAREDNNDVNIFGEGSGLPWIIRQTQLYNLFHALQMSEIHPVFWILNNMCLLICSKFVFVVTFCLENEEYFFEENTGSWTSHPYCVHTDLAIAQLIKFFHTLKTSCNLFALHCSEN